MFKVLTSRARSRKAGAGKGDDVRRICVCPSCGDSFEAEVSDRFCSDPCRTAWLKAYVRRPEQLAV